MKFTHAQKLACTQLWRDLVVAMVSAGPAHSVESVEDIVNTADYVCAALCARMGAGEAKSKWVAEQAAKTQESSV